MLLNIQSKPYPWPLPVIYTHAAALKVYMYYCYACVYVGVAWSPCWWDEAYPPGAASGVCKGWQVHWWWDKPYSLSLPNPLSGWADPLCRTLRAGHELKLSHRVHDWVGVSTRQLHQHWHTGIQDITDPGVRFICFSYISHSRVVGSCVIQGCQIFWIEILRHMKCVILEWE